MEKEEFGWGLRDRSHMEDEEMEVYTERLAIS